MKPTGALFTALLAIIANLLILFPLNAQNWPMANGCKERTSWASAEKELLPPLNKRMEFSLSGGIASGISSYQDMLFESVEADPNRLIAFNMLDGSERWQFEIPNTLGSVNVTPAVNDSLVLCGGQGGLGLYALDRLAGIQQWFKGVGSMYSNNPIIDSARLYVVADSLYCLDIADGTTTWTYPFSGSISPTVDDEMLYICGYRILMAFNKLNGEKIWQIENSQKHLSSLAVDENCLYTFNYDSVIALHKKTGIAKWSYPMPDGEPSVMSLVTIATTDSILCFPIWEDSTSRGQLYALDKTTGNHLWHHTFDSLGVYAPAIANGIVYTVNWKAYAIWGFDLNTGQAVFFDDSEGYLKQPIVANGKLLIGTHGKVVTFENHGTGLMLIPTNEPKSPGLLQNWPNPFKHSTCFEFYLEQPEDLTIAVYDLNGKRVKTISDKKFEPGAFSLTWDATNDSNQKVPPGIYILKLSTKNHNSTKRMMFLK